MRFIHSALIAATLFAPAASAQVLLSEGFDSVSSLGSAGWFFQNNSVQASATGAWQQGNPGDFTSQSGPNNSFAESDFRATSFSGFTGGTISDWMVTPTVPLTNGTFISFYSRASGDGFPDNIEIRLSTSGASTNVGPALGNTPGTTPSTYGDFGTLLGQTNPSGTPFGFPSTWTLYNFTVSGLSSPTTGRFAFHRYIINGGAAGERSENVGVDTVVVTVPEPSALAFVGVAAVGVWVRRRKSNSTRL